MIVRMPSCRSLITLTTVFLLASFAIAAEPASGQQTLVVAHRGLLKHAPENTLANFRTCLQLRIGFELDVRRSKDGQLIVLHDDTVDRTTDGQGKAAEFTLAELKQLDAGGWFDAAFQNERIPTLDEVFVLIATAPMAPIIIAVDLKGDDPEIEVDVVRAALKRGVLARLLFIGRTIDNPDVRQRLREASLKTHVACLANTSKELPAAIVDRWSDWAYVRFLPSEKEMAKIHAANKRVFIAGSNVAGRQPKNWKVASERTIDGVLTDYPIEFLQGQRRRAQAP